MQALHFGAGNIGRGFIGKALADANWRVCFADVNPTMISTLQKEQSYAVTVVAEGFHEVQEVHNVSGVLVQDEEALRKQVTAVQLITTAVGVNILAKIAPVLASALQYRWQQGIETPLNIVACENAIAASQTLKNEVLRHLSASDADAILHNIAFVDCAVDRIVPPSVQEHPLAVTVEHFSEWVLNQNQWLGERLQAEGVIYTDNLMAYVERKLFTLNTGHAATAYEGFLRGAKTVQEALQIPEVAAAVRATMAESGAVLIQRYGFETAAHNAYIDKIMKRFANPYLQDDVHRVGREPLRKISPQDRIIKPLRGALEYGLPHDALLRTLAAALHYRHEADPEALQLAQSIAKQGVIATVRHYCGLQDEALLLEIEKQYQNIT